MRTKHLFLVLIALAGLPAVVNAQPRKSIEGQVKDASNGDFLPGAAIYLDGTNYATISDMEGNYIMYGVPSGSYTLKVSYIGFDEFESPVSVREGEVITRNIDLQPTFIELHGVEVVGQRQGQMKALNMQKEADNQMNIVASEQMERFPDLNTAEVLQRLPGVNISRDLGEGKFVSIRGTDPRFTQVKVNGEAIATPEDEERFVALNVISATQLSSIEVTKSPTPRMDGDAIGGVVDLKTRSAFDSDKRILRVAAGGGYQDKAKGPNIRGDVTFASKLGESEKFGLSLNANYQLLNKHANGIEPRWSNDAFDIYTNPLPTVFSDIEMKHFVANRTRYGASGEFEYRPNSTSKFKIGGMYNLRDDQQTRNMRRIRANRGMYITADTVFNARSYFELHDRLESQEIYALNAAGEHDLDWLKINYNVAFSHGLQEKSGEGQIKAEFQSDDRFTLVTDPNDHRIPRFQYFDIQGVNFIPLTEDSIIDPKTYALDQLDWRVQHTTNQDLVGAIDFTMPYNLGAHPGSFQFGGKARIRSKDRDNERIKNRHTDYVIPMPPYVKETVGDFLEGNYQFGPLIDPTEMRNFYKENGTDSTKLEPEYRWVESLGETYYAQERVLAGYAMFRQNFGNLLLLGGIRIEQTQTKYDGKDLNLDSNGEYISHEDISSSRTYLNFFPNLQGRYRVTPGTNIRLAFTTGIMRPNYYSLVPYYIVSDKDRTILQGNPELKPTRSANLDFSVEHYFQKVGVATVAVFAKQLEDLAYTQITRDTTPGDYYNWESRQVLNGGSAQLIGIELNWSQQFTFLPSFLNGFGIYANYTHNQALNSEVFGRDLGSRIPGLSPDVGNIALTYEKHGITARLAWNFSGTVLEELGEIDEGDEDIWIDNYSQLDFSGAYEIIKGLEFFVEVNNILNNPYREYFGIADRTYQLEYYSWAFNAGIKWQLR
jgi:TonB-dependent receptor